jgi:NADH-quinone oxidoreductase subunit L
LFIAVFPYWSEYCKNRFVWLYNILVNKYGFDEFNQVVLVHGTQDLGHLFYNVSDVKIIDGVAVNGSGRFVQWFALIARRMQTGYIYHYALAMVLGILVFLVWYVGV